MPTRTCPYCNALLDGFPQESPAACPVCGEHLAAAATPQPTAAPAAPPNRRAALLVLVGMLVCAGLALGYALWTQAGRRANDQGPGPRPPRSPFDPPEPAVLVPPDRLAALGYLPAGLDLLVGVHFAALYDDPATRPLLDQPLPVGPATVRLADLRSWTGLAPEAIDHAVLGVGLPGAALLPRVVLVVRGRRPIDGDAVKAALRATEETTAGRGEKKQLWKVRLAGVNLPAWLWLADDRTLVFGLTPADLARLPVAGSDRLDHLPGRVKELLRTRLDAGVATWAVGSFLGGLGKAVGPAFPLVVQGLTLSPEQRKTVAGLQGIAGGVVPGPTLTFGLNLELENADGAAQVADYLRGPEGKAPLRVERDGASVLLQWKATPADLAGLLPR